MRTRKEKMATTNSHSFHHSANKKQIRKRELLRKRRESIPQRLREKKFKIKQNEYEYNKGVTQTNKEDKENRYEKK